jgi:hypothetical protein
MRSDFSKYSIAQVVFGQILSTCRLLSVGGIMADEGMVAAALIACIFYTKMPPMYRCRSIHAIDQEKW